MIPSRRRVGVLSRHIILESSSTAAPKDIRLHYFRTSGRGELSRLCFIYGGIPFQDYRYTTQEFVDIKDGKPGAKLPYGEAATRTPFGQLPSLEVDGEMYGQTLPIARFAARVSGLWPEGDDAAALKCDMIIERMADIMTSMTPIFMEGVPATPTARMKSKEEVAEGMARFFGTNLPPILKQVSALLGEQDYFVKNKISVADMAVFNRLGELSKTAERYKVVDFLGATPNLKAHLKRIGDTPRIAKWMASRPKEGEVGQGLVSLG